MEILGGSLFAVAGAGESHGPAITTIVFGCPPGQRISRGEIQTYLDRRRPGSNKLGTPRREGDKVVILSGVYSDDHDLLSGSRIAAAVGEEEVSAPGYEKGFATGEPIAAVVLSAAKRTADYAQFLGPSGDVRPGHTDLVKHHKSQGFTDPRGGGRSSYRSTISDVFGGSIARLCLRDRFGTAFLSSICQVGELRSGRRLADRVQQLPAGGDGRVPAAALEELEAALEEPEIRTLDAEFGRAAADLIADTRKQGDSVGAAIEVVAANVPPLAGEPLYDSLKARLMGSLGGLHAVQACEVGSGIEVVSRRGSGEQRPDPALGLPGQPSRRHHRRRHHRHAPGLPGLLQTDVDDPPAAAIGAQGPERNRLRAAEGPARSVRGSARRCNPGVAHGDRADGCCARPPVEEGRRRELRAFLNTLAPCKQP